VRETLEKRLNELKSELSAGESLLSELQTKQASLQQTMLRISGAIQVLEELLARETESSGAAKPQAELPPMP